MTAKSSGIFRSVIVVTVKEVVSKYTRIKYDYMKNSHLMDEGKHKNRQKNKNDGEIKHKNFHILRKTSCYTRYNTEVAYTWKFAATFHIVQY